MERKEYLIVGQGLAGSVLAWTLLEEGADIKVLDRDEGADCSMVSGGMINPISPRQPTKAWQAEIHLPEAENFYRQVEGWTGTDLYFPKTIYRPYESEEEKGRWERNARPKDYDRFLWPKSPEGIPGVSIDPGLGAAAFQGAHLDTPTFLDATAKSFLKKGILERTSFDPSELIAKDEEWEWKGCRFKKLILCQGTGILQCPFFGHLPLRPNKGEILTLEMPDLPEHFILNRGFYAIPLGAGKVRIGATYDHQDRDPAPTQRKKEDLLDRMSSWIELPYRVLDQQAGFRPTTPDTRPYVGFHHHHQGLAIFNGLGSKGASLAPHWAKRLTEKLQKGDERAPDPTVELHRFKGNKKSSEGGART